MTCPKRPTDKDTAPDGRRLVALAVGCGTGFVGLLPGGQTKRRDQMTRVLNALRKEPVSGDTRSVVVFVHGYGANGADLLGLADPLGEHLPDTLFVAPDAPGTDPRNAQWVSVVPNPVDRWLVRGRGAPWHGNGGRGFQRVSSMP